MVHANRTFDFFYDSLSISSVVTVLCMLITCFIFFPREMTSEDLKLKEKLTKGHDKTLLKVRTNCACDNSPLNAGIMQSNV